MPAPFHRPTQTAESRYPSISSCNREEKGSEPRRRRESAPDSQDRTELIRRVVALFGAQIRGTA
jgi:hypothetical protein